MGSIGERSVMKPRKYIINFWVHNKYLKSSDRHTHNLYAYDASDALIQFELYIKNQNYDLDYKGNRNLHISIDSLNPEMPINEEDM